MKKKLRWPAAQGTYRYAPVSRAMPRYDIQVAQRNSSCRNSCTVLVIEANSSTVTPSDSEREKERERGKKNRKKERERKEVNGREKERQRGREKAREKGHIVTPIALEARSGARILLPCLSRYCETIYRTKVTNQNTNISWLVFVGNKLFAGPSIRYC